MYAVYRKSDGVLVSMGTVVANPLPDGLVAAVVDPPSPTHIWDTSKRAFVQGIVTTSSPLDTLKADAAFAAMNQGQQTAILNLIQKYLSQYVPTQIVNVVAPPPPGP